ncbi:MAG TPA: hypothetical protein VM100_04120 [Longimicrobiales bacterium]|nr:hypothetical protein [Longimicrobiales bacterium]
MARARLINGVAMLLVLVGCSSDSSGPGTASRLGRYRLVRINGAPLPALVTEGNSARIDFLGGAVHLNADLTFVDSTDLKITPRAGGASQFITDVAQGTYRISQDTVFFTSSRPGERYYMTYLSHESLRQDLAGSILIYNR